MPDRRPACRTHHSLLCNPQLAKFKEFWAATEPLADLLKGVSGFFDTTRAYICSLHADAYRRCPKAVLREALNLPEAEFDALVQKHAAAGWKAAGDAVEFPFDEQAAQQQQPQTGAGETIPFGKLEPLFSKQPSAAAA